MLNFISDTEPDLTPGPIDSLRNVFLKAMAYVPSTEYDQLICEWNDAVEYCQKIFGGAK